MASLLAVGGLNGSAFVHVGGEFLLQMGVGGGIGVAGGRALMWFIRRVPGEGLYPLRTLAGALVLYGVATLAHGSGFLAVFVAGILVGDGRAPFKREIERFHGALASLGEIVAFVVLGLTVNLSVLARPDVWIPGLVLGAALALLIRPVMVGVCLLQARLDRAERVFVLFAGLKGAVPILLGSLLLTVHAADVERLYGIVVVVVVFSVAVQGSLVPTLARALRLPMRAVEPEPWALGVRLRHEPDGAHRFTIAPGSPADGRTLPNWPNYPASCGSVCCCAIIIWSRSRAPLSSTRTTKSWSSPTPISSRNSPPCSQCPHRARPVIRVPTPASSRHRWSRRIGGPASSVVSQCGHITATELPVVGPLDARS
jgi:cell volume regulation protein A